LYYKNPLCIGSAISATAIIGHRTPESAVAMCIGIARRGERGERRGQYSLPRCPKIYF